MLNTRPPRPAVALLSLAALLTGTWVPRACAGRLPPDPVKEFLREGGRNRGNVELLRTISDVGRVLVADEFANYPDLATKSATPLFNLFEKKVRRVIREGDPLEQEAVADLVSGMAATARKSNADTLLATGAGERPKGSPRVAAPYFQRLRLRLAGLADDLKQLLKSPNVRVRNAAVRALGNIGADSEKVMPVLKKALDPGEPVSTRRAAASALGDLLRVAGKAGGIPSYPLYSDTELTEKQKEQLRIKATLKRMSAEPFLSSRLSLPVAEKGLTDPDAEVRRLSAGAYRQTITIAMDLMHPPPAPKDVRAGEWKIYQAEHDGLKPLLKEYEKSAPTLRRRAGRDPDPTVRVAVLDILTDLSALRRRIDLRQKFIEEEKRLPEEIKPEGTASGGRGVKEGRGEASGLTLVAARAFQAKKSADPTPPLDRTLKETLDALAADLSSPNDRVRLSALDVLESMGMEAVPAAGALVRALEDRNRFVRWASSRILGKLADGLAGQDRSPPLPDQAVPRFVRIVTCDQDLDLRIAAATAIELYGPSAESAVAALREAVGRGDPEIRIAIMHALVGIGTAAEPALDAVAAQLDPRADRDPRARKVAAETLGRFGVSSPRIIAALRAALDDPDNGVRAAATEALLSLRRR